MPSSSDSLAPAGSRRNSGKGGGEEDKEEWIRDETCRLLTTRAPRQYVLRLPPALPLSHSPFDVSKSERGSSDEDRGGGEKGGRDKENEQEDERTKQVKQEKQEEEKEKAEKEEEEKESGGQEEEPYPLYARSKARVETLVHHAVKDTTEPVFREYVSYALEGGKRVRPVLALSLVDALLERWREREKACSGGEEGRQQQRRVQQQVRECRECGRERTDARSATQGGDDDARALPAKVLRAAEMICLVPEILHSASLIADDLPCMDNAEERRGRPCMHRRYDEAVAVLTAVHLLTMSTRMIARAYRMLMPYGIGDADNIIALIEELSACMGFQGASGGQMLDLARVRIDDNDNDDDNDKDKDAGNGDDGDNDDGNSITAAGGSNDAFADGRAPKNEEGEERKEKKEDERSKRRQREALKRMMCMKTSSFFRIALLSAVYVCSPVRLDDDVAAQIGSVSDNLGLAFQTFDDFDDALEDFDDARERANNCVNVLGAQASYERFSWCVHHSVRVLQSLGLYNGVIQEFLDMMHRRILHKMESMTTTDPGKKIDGAATCRAT